jgi:antitoxin (DNA-binding transcriptional repressor) of toxin-antitoxin stability system
MSRVSLEDAQTHLSELIATLQANEEVEIVSEGRIVARLIGESEPIRQARQPGSAVGTLTILADDDEHLTDFEDYMP